MDDHYVGSSFKLTHSRSTPAGMDRTVNYSSDPATPKKSGKILTVKVCMLDDTISVFHVQAKALGRVLFHEVCKQLNLLECDYFGLEYHSEAATFWYWLDLERPMQRQVGLSMVDPVLRFCVKFYTPDPVQLEEEYTRYLFCLQIKRDLIQGDFHCNENTATLIISYIIQAECGDFFSEDYPDHTYLSCHKFTAYQDHESERRIMENHKRHAGQSPAEADLNLLETARRCDLYGMKMHSAKDQDSIPLNLAVGHMGIVVFQNSTRINTFSWAKIRKISFKRKRFLIKLHPEGYGYYKDVVEYTFDKRNECKSFWKKCVENHGFFRCTVVLPKQRPKVLSRGSSFRYSGRTQKQVVEYVRENFVKRQTFQRSQSFRHTSSAYSSSVAIVTNHNGSSISAHPLIPLGECVAANSKASLSCGSMTLSGSPSPITRPEGFQVAVQEASMAQQQRDKGAKPPTCAVTSASPPSDSGQKRRATNRGVRSGVGGGRSDYSKSRERHPKAMLDDPDILKDLMRTRVDDFSWQRSSSCRELGSRCRVDLDRTRTPSFDSRQASIETKVFSSSYPGTTPQTSLDSDGDDKMASGSIFVEFMDGKISHDDLSHDSYEILERDLFGGRSSRSSSVDSDELYEMNKRELWREGPSIGENLQRLGEVRIAYRDIGFDEFNEICKKGFASRRGDSHMRFSEFDIKSNREDAGYAEFQDHECVLRTKSEPYMTTSNKCKHRLSHQKSFDYPPVDNASKTSLDMISYKLHKRNAVNGTARYRDDQIYANVVPNHMIENGNGVKVSKDSGLSSSLGEGEMDLKNLLLTRNYETVVTTCKSANLMLSLSEETTTEVLTSDDPSPLVESKPFPGEIANGDKEGKHKKRGKIAVKKSRVTDFTADGRWKEIIVIDSDDYHSLDDSRSDKKSDGSDSVVIVEYRGNKKKRLCKKASSGSRGSQADSEASSFDVPRYNNKNEGGIFKRSSSQFLQVPSIRITSLDQNSEERYTSDQSDNKSDPSLEMQRQWNDDETIAADIVIPPPPVEFQTPPSTPKGMEPPKPLSPPVDAVAESCELPDRLESARKVWMRLAFSESSAVQKTGNLSPGCGRRSKSLDTPVVFRSKLPPVTAFSSNDDTVDTSESALITCTPVSVATEEFHNEDEPEEAPFKKPPKISWSFRKLSLQLPKETRDEISREEVSGGKERSKSDGYSGDLALSSAPERKGSTRQQRMNSFKRLKDFSIDIWDSKEKEAAKNAPVVVKCDTSKEEDDVFLDAESSSEYCTTNDDKKAEAPVIVLMESSPVEEEPKLLQPEPATAVKEGEEKRSFDEEVSSVTTSSSAKPIPYVPLESSGSSSVEDAAVLPIDAEDPPPVAARVESAAVVLYTGKFPSALGGAFYSLARSLSRISERSTASEMESPRKGMSSRSISDNSMTDQHLSLSSDPPSGMNLDNVFDDDDDSDSKLGIREEEWPSPPESTLTATNEESRDLDLDSDEKTLPDVCCVAIAAATSNKPRGSIDDSLGCFTEDFSSSTTGTTIKQVPHYEDNSSLGGLSLGMEATLWESGKRGGNSGGGGGNRSFDEYDSPCTDSGDDEGPPPPLPASYLEDKELFHPSDASGGEEKIFLEVPDIKAPLLLSEPKPDQKSSLTTTADFEISESMSQPLSIKIPSSSAATPAWALKIRSKVERSRAKFFPHCTSSSMSTSLESPTSVERKQAKKAARAKCYSYYSLARSPPSDDSSSSMEAPRTPSTPNTIPRASKKKRYTPPNSKQRRGKADSRSRERRVHRSGATTLPVGSHLPSFYYPSVNKRN